MPHNRRRAFTLIEVLTVIGITVVLVGLIAPALSAAKVRAKVAADISALHQLGIAGALYNDQYGDFPTGCPTLVSTGNVPNSLCGGLADPITYGAANRIVMLLAQRSDLYKGLETKYRNSFIGAREIGYTAKELRESQIGGTNPGWLVDVSSGKLIGPESLVWLGPYRRLCYDTSVITRTARQHHIVYQGRPAMRRSVTEWFIDPPSGQTK